MAINIIIMVNTKQKLLFWMQLCTYPTSKWWFRQNEMQQWLWIWNHRWMEWNGILWLIVLLNRFTGGTSTARRNEINCGLWFSRSTIYKSSYIHIKGALITLWFHEMIQIRNNDNDYICALICTRHHTRIPYDRNLYVEFAKNKTPLNKLTRKTCNIHNLLIYCAFPSVRGIH